MDRLSDGVGKRHVEIVDIQSGERLATGILSGIAYELDGDHRNVSEASIALDIPDEVMAGGSDARPR